MHKRWTKLDRKCATLCLTVLLCAVGVRALERSGVAQQLEETVETVFTAANAARWIIYLETGQKTPPPKTEPETETTPVETTAQPTEPETTAPETTAPETTTAPKTETAAPETTAPQTAVPEALAFTAEEAEAISVSGSCTYSPDLAALLTQPLQARFSAAGPQVLIVHTHTCEAYAMEPGWEYTPASDCRTLDPAYNMVRVGDAIASCLEAQGIGVIHDTEINDYPSYNGAYDRMLTVIQDYLTQYPTISMVLDVHRDAAVDDDGQQVAMTATWQEESYAKLMLVVGTDEGGLEHPDWQENLQFSLQLEALLNRDAAALCRGISLRKERYNEHLTPCSLLVEVGSAGNTLQQALRSAELFGQTLARLIQAQTATS